MSVSFCRTPLLRTLSVGVAALCIAHTPALADNQPPPGAQHFDFAAAWGRPAVPFTSFTALLRKDVDETVPEELLCSEFQCGTWIGDEHSPEDEFDLIGTLTFIDLIPFPVHLETPGYLLSDLNPDLQDMDIEGEVVLHRFLMTARLATPTGYDRYVHGLVVRSDIHFSQPEEETITSATLFVAYEWAEPAGASAFTAMFADTIYSSGATAATPVVSGGEQHNYVEPAVITSPDGIIHQQPGGLTMQEFNNCVIEWSNETEVCRSGYDQAVQSIMDVYEQQMAGHKAAYQASVNNVPLNLAAGAGGAWIGFKACAKLGAAIGCAVPIVGPIAGGALGGGLGAAGGLVIGFFGSRLAEDWYDSNQYRMAAASEGAIRDTALCQEITSRRPCLQQAYDNFLVCIQGHPLVPVLPLDNILPTPVPINCPGAAPLTPIVPLVPYQSP